MKASFQAISYQPKPINHFLEKPIAKDELRSAIREILK